MARKDPEVCEAGGYLVIGEQNVPVCIFGGGVGSTIVHIEKDLPPLLPPTSLPNSLPGTLQNQKG